VNMLYEVSLCCRWKWLFRSKAKWYIIYRTIMEQRIRHGRLRMMCMYICLFS